MKATLIPVRQLYDWDGYGWLRAPLAIVLALSAVALGFALSMTVEGRRATDRLALDWR